MSEACSVCSVIERKIGSVSSFELRNSQRQKVKTIGSAKQEVIQIRDQFNLQVDNPIMVMTQVIHHEFSLHASSCALVGEAKAIYHSYPIIAI